MICFGAFKKNIIPFLLLNIVRGDTFEIKSNYLKKENNLNLRKLKYDSG